MRKYKLSVVLIGLVFLFGACGLLSEFLKKTEDANGLLSESLKKTEDANLLARMELNNTVERYFVYYDAAPENLQAIWHVKIDPLIWNAMSALDLWDLAMASNTDIARTQAQYMTAKNLFLEEIIKLLGVEIK